MDTNDNQQAIKLQNDVSCLLQGIESNNAAHIDAALVNLKKHTEDFEAVFHKNLLNSLYGTRRYYPGVSIDCVASALAARTQIKEEKKMPR